MSSIARKRDPALKELLIKYTKDNNPEVALQAIRGLLVFREDPNIKEYLISLGKHPNDMIQDVIHQEMFKEKFNITETMHADSPDFMKNTVVLGDVLKIIKYVPDDSIHLTFTSPPYYNAREYSIYSNYEEYLTFLEQVFKELHRITKEGRFFILNTSPVIIPRAGRKYASRRYPVPFDIHGRLSRIGWEFIDDIIWAKPEVSAKNRVAGFEGHRKPLTYKANPRTEYVIVYRKKSHKLIDWNLKQYSEDIIEKSKANGEFERSNVWNIFPATDKIHSAVFPIQLCEQIVKLYSFQKDLVFDPFAGSGTLGKASILNDRYCFLTEMKEEYFNRIYQNLANVGSIDINLMTTEKFREESKKWL